MKVTNTIFKAYFKTNNNSEICGGLGEAGGGEGEEGDADVGDVAQAFGTTEQRGTCGDHIVDNHHMLACERFICFGD